VTDEQVLIHRAQGGEMEAFRRLVERSRARVYRLAYDLTGNRHDAEDLTQEIYLKAYRSLNQFRGEALWSTWLHRIAVNAYLDNRRTARTMEVLDEAADGSLDHHGALAPGPERMAESAMIQENIQRALNSLTPQERSVFVLRHYNDLPLRDIAAAMNIREGTVKTYLFRAVRRLQRELSFYANEPTPENPS
jgi:RNA polymerase sigma-70 factor (ECF subfamily)